jgi:hypothetical protein
MAEPSETRESNGVAIAMPAKSCEDRRVLPVPGLRVPGTVQRRPVSLTPVFSSG